MASNRRCYQDTMTLRATAVVVVLLDMHTLSLHLLSSERSHLESEVPDFSVFNRSPFTGPTWPWETCPKWDWLKQTSVHNALKAAQTISFPPHDLPTSSFLLDRSHYFLHLGLQNPTIPITLSPRRQHRIAPQAKLQKSITHLELSPGK